MINNRNILAVLFFIVSFTLFGQTQKSDNWLSDGNDYFSNLQYEKAIQSYQKSWNKNENRQALWGLANATFELGNQYQFNGKPQAAQENFKQALIHSETLVALDKTKADFLLFQGLMYLYNKNSEQAVLDFEEAKSKFPSSGRAYYYLWTQVVADASTKVQHEYIQKALSLEPDLFELHQELGAYYTSLNQPEPAITHYEKALDISPKNYKANFALGQIYWALGDLEKMRIHFQQSIDYFPDFGYAKMLLAGVELMSANMPAAIPLIRAALKDNPATEQYLNMFIQNYPELANYNFRESNNDSPLEANGYPKYYSQAVAAAQAYDFYGAIDLLHQCNDLYSQYDQAQPAWETSILSWLTHCYREIGNYAAASQTGNQALNLAITNNIKTDQASLSANLSMVYYTWGDYPKAIQYARASIEFLIANQQPQQLYDAYINIGSYYRRWGQADSAVYFHKKALNEISSATDLKYVLAQKELAISYVNLQKYNEAKEVIEKMNKTRASGSYSDQDPALDLGCAEVYYALGEYQKAWEYISSSFEHFSDLEQVSPDHPTLIPFLENYIGLAVKLELNDLANSNYQALNNKLINQIATYFSAMSENGKLLFYREIKQHFESFNSFAINQTDLNQTVLHQLYENQLLVKGLLFNDAAKIQNTVTKSEDRTLKNTYQKLLDKKNLLARSITLSNDEKMNRGVDQQTIQQEIDSLQIKLIKQGMEPSSHRVYEPELVQKVKKSLQKAEAAVEIVRFKTYDFSNGGFYTDQIHYLALIIKAGSDEISFVHIKNGNYLESKGYQAYTNAISFELKDTNSYNNYWEPIVSKLSGVNRIYFSGDGVYHKININTLLNPTSNQFVIDELDVRLVTSTRELIKKNSVLPKDGQVFLVGFPTYNLDIKESTSVKNTIQKTFATRAFTNIENLEPLPGTYSEVTTIASILDESKWKTKVLTGEDAIEEKIKDLQNPTILHIATHGFFEESSPKDNPLFYSGLFLSGASSIYQNKSETEEDGILTAYEAMHLQLNQTEMVVLSACETGMGRVENGEGVYGLQRAFLIAGSKSVVMSFWKVNDQTTMDLMINFYKNLNAQKDRHIAFRNAQLELKNQYPNPKYWGAFNIVGR